MIDLHNHLLPGVDDGAATIAVTREMLARSARFGYRTIVATPHLHDRLGNDERVAVAARLADARREAEPHGITVLGGFEVFLTPDLPRRLADGEPSTIGGTRSILVELPFVGWPTYTDATLFALQTAGYRPILAHPERYQAVQQQPELAIALARRGILLQLTLRSLIGSSRRVQKASADLLAAGAIALVATDAHGNDHRLAAVPEALGRLERLVGRDRLARIVDVNPAAVLAGDPVDPVDGDGDQPGAPEHRRRRWWKLGQRDG